MMVIVDPKLELKYNSLQEDLKNKDLEITEKASIVKFLELDKVRHQASSQLIKHFLSSF